MFKRLAGMVAAFLLLGTSAQAADYKLTVTAADFEASSAGPDPTIPVFTGSFVFSAPSAGDDWVSLKSVDWVIAGHRYDLADVDFLYGGARVWVGGRTNTIHGVFAGTDDFLLGKYEGVSFLIYSTPSSDETWESHNIKYSFEEVTAVPEPETYAMLLAGLGLMGAVARRRKA